MLEFDAETTRMLERAYHGSDFARRRRAAFDALRPEGGDRIVDIGCGNGMLTRDLALAVGEAGEVVGVDPSADMRGAAERRLEGHANARVVSGSAAALPLASASMDTAVSIQVFEYVEDVSAALVEAHRVLRPGGRLVVGDMHFGTLVWFSDVPARMAGMRGAWNRHLTHAALPAVLPARMIEAGFVVEEVIACTFTDRTLRPDGLSRMMIVLMSRYALQHDLVDADDVEDWAEEQTALAEAGRFFFSMSHFLTCARKPGSPV